MIRDKFKDTIIETKFSVYFLSTIKFYKIYKILHVWKKMVYISNYYYTNIVKLIFPKITLYYQYL